jgi:hypothetical protein
MNRSRIITEVKILRMKAEKTSRKRKRRAGEVATATKKNW